ncbi:unnamed protein product [Moneuplotes crassus]|uniref:Uncharacterized protein n=1 Tax=Euplotes crassus TaxID=5936 RepID=A0AAD1X3X2_EUPCR|nr:unnamed protein product [Moneuplotes crassus]
MDTFAKSNNLNIYAAKNHGKEQDNLRGFHCDSCVMALRQLLACDRCFTHLGQNLVKLLMFQLNNVLDPCNAPVRRKKSIYSENTNDEDSSFARRKRSQNNRKSRNLQAFNSAEQHNKTLMSKNSKHFKEDAIGLRLRGNNNLNSSIQFSESKGDITPNTHVSGNFNDNFNSSANATGHRQIRSKKRLLRQASRTLKVKKRSTLTKKQIIKKSMSLIKLGFLKKLKDKIKQQGKDSEATEDDNPQKDSPVLVPKSKKSAKLTLEPIKLKQRSSGSDKSDYVKQEPNTSLKELKELSISKCSKKRSKNKKVNLKILARRPMDEADRSHTGSTGKSSKSFKVD